MRVQNRNIAIICAAGMLLLILDSKTALYGATEGIDMCISALIPSLFPFFVLSIILTGALSGQVIKCLQPVGDICKMPPGTEYILAIGFLGGYPVGAHSISQLSQQGKLTDLQAMRLLAFCNNAGPSFIFGVLGSMFSSPIISWLLWCVYLLSALLVGIFLPSTECKSGIQTQIGVVRFTDALSRAVKVQAVVCGWVVFMRIVLAYMEKWVFHFFPVSIQIILSGLLELSNGCIRLAELDREGLRFLIACALLSLGGICVTLQTASAANGISMRMYFPGKALQCCFCTLLGCLFQFAFPICARCSWIIPAAISTILIVLITLYLRFPKKEVEFPDPLMYNGRNITKEVSSCCFGNE